MKFKSLFTILFLIIFVCNVLPQSIYIYKHKDLNFGDVFIGYSKNILHFNYGAAKFSMHHNFLKKKDFLITFVLPEYLLNGKNYLPIKFDRQNAAWSFRDRRRNRRRFNPNNPLIIRGVKQNRSIFIWLGGKIYAKNNLLPGTYKGTIILTVEFL